MAKTKCMASLKGITTLLTALYRDTNPHHQEALEVLRENIDLARYAVTSALYKLQQVNQTGVCDGAEGANKDQVFKYCKRLARILMKQYASHLEAENEANKRERSKQLCLLSLEALMVVFNIASTRYKSSLEEFLQSIDTSRESGVAITAGLGLEEVVHKQIKKLQRMVVKVLTSEDEARSTKEAVFLLAIIATLTKHLSPEGDQFTQLVNWTHRLCTEQTTDDTNLCKTLVTQLLQLTCQQKSCAQLLRDLSRDIHCQLGDIAEDVQLDATSAFAVVNVRTAAPSVLLLTLTQIEHELDDTEWVIQRLKARLTAEGDATNEAVGSPGLSQREGQEKSLCGRLGHVVNAFHELVQSALPAGSCVEATLKSLTRLYGTLTALVKYNLSMYTLKSGHLTPRFEKLVKLSAINLTQQVYAMITFIQATQNENLQLAVDKAKGGKKKGDAAVTLGKARVLKETKSIPNLIFAIEQYERYLIQLSKKSKISLMDHFKMSTARDFRINAVSVEAALEDQATSSDSDSDREGAPPAEPEPEPRAADDLGEETDSEGVNSENEDPEPIPPPAKKTKGKLSARGRKKGHV